MLTHHGKNVRDISLILFSRARASAVACLGD